MNNAHTSFSLQPLSSPVARNLLKNNVQLANIQLVASDVDGTLTHHGKLSDLALTSIARLANAGIAVVLVSGRPAGELLGLCRYIFGVTLGIAENGLIQVVPDAPPKWLGPQVKRDDLFEVAAKLNSTHNAKLRCCSDVFCRLGDVAYEREDREEVELLRLQKVTRDYGVYLTWSSIHIHLTHAPPDKGAGLLKVLEMRGIDPMHVATIGDAPNDAGLFVPGRFGLMVGTAEIIRYRQSMPHMPSFITNEPEIKGFAQLAQLLLAS